MIQITYTIAENIGDDIIETEEFEKTFGSLVDMLSYFASLFFYLGDRQSVQNIMINGEPWKPTRIDPRNEADFFDGDASHSE